MIWGTQTEKAGERSLVLHFPLAGPVIPGKGLMSLSCSLQVSKAEICHLLLFPVGCTMRDPECSFSGDIKSVEDRFAAPSPSSTECICH